MLKISYSDGEGYRVSAYRETIMCYGGEIPTYLNGEIWIKLPESFVRSSGIMDSFLAGNYVLVEDRLNTWETIPTSVSYSMSDKKETMINLRFTIVG